MNAVFTYDENGKMHMINVTLIDSCGSDFQKRANEKISKALQELGCVPVYKTNEEKVRAERRKMHLSQDYVAGYCGMTPWVYACVESGHGKFKQEELDLINQLFYTNFRA